MTEAGLQLLKLTECCICLKEFTDPRMLPCIHTFCLGCLKQTPYQKNLGRRSMWLRKTIPCPVCRKLFTIPAEDLDGLQKNFFMEHLMEITKDLQLSNMSSIACDICKVLYEGEEKTKNATMRCLDCRDNFCDLCAKAHTLHKSTISHHIVKIGSETEDDMRRISPTRNCNLHNQKPLDYYCPKCKKIFCVSCVLENHASHGCKDVSSVEKEFRQVIERNAVKISIYADEILPKIIGVEKKKENILLKLAKTESEIRQRHLELIEMIDNHTTTLLEELSLIKQKQVKDCENEKEEIERIHTIFQSYHTYCTELISKGSASDVCSCVDELITRTSELDKDHEAFICRPCQMADISFTAENLLKRNIVGQIQESLSQVESCVIIAGLSNGPTITKDTLELNLHRPQVIANQRQIPTTMQNGAFAAVHSNTMYVTGLGDNLDEIWKYNSTSGWMKCASLVQGRSRHCAAFIDEVLYICGGCLNLDGSVLDSVEAFNAINNRCTTVGKLVYCVKNSGNCVPFHSSLYIFGGADKDNKALNYVQMYDTKRNICTLLSKPVPYAQGMMRAAHLPWQTSVILLGCYTCFIFNLETETWQERKRFKTDVAHFGLALVNERLFVIGGGMSATDPAGNVTWTCRDDVRYVPLQNVIDDRPVEWKSYAKLERPALVQTCGTVMHNSPGKTPNETWA